MSLAERVLRTGAGAHQLQRHFAPIGGKDSSGVGLCCSNQFASWLLLFDELQWLSVHEQRANEGAIDRFVTLGGQESSDLHSLDGVSSQGLPTVYVS